MFNNRYKSPVGPEMYSEKEMDALENHISTYFGDFENVFHEVASPDIHVDIYIIPPTPERNYYTLITGGMGAHIMNVPPELRKKKLDRAEIVVCLPPDWEIESSKEASYWPLRWLKILARLPGNENSWLGWGHTIPNGQPFADNTQLSGVILIDPQGVPEEAFSFPLPNGSRVNFYQMLPIYEEEMAFKLQQSAESLLERFTPEMLQVVDLQRENVCAEKHKNFRLSHKEIQPLLEDWKGPEGCLATDRILVDGCPVGYMYRMKPERDDANWDSGWRFLAGDEDDAYMDNPDHTGVYDLNLICNYDPAILPYLTEKIGSGFSRCPDGSFRSDPDGGPFARD